VTNTDFELDIDCPKSSPSTPKLYRPWSLGEEDEPCRKVQRTNEKDTPLKDENDDFKCDSVKRKLFTE
jgi:hypothetical protein